MRVAVPDKNEAAKVNSDVAPEKRTTRADGNAAPDAPQARKTQLLARFKLIKRLPRKHVIVALILIVTALGGTLPFVIKSPIKSPLESSTKDPSKHSPSPELAQLEQIKKANQLLEKENKRIKTEVTKYKDRLAKMSAAPPSAKETPVATTASTPQISVIFPKNEATPPEDCSISDKAQIREVLKRCIAAFNAASKTIASLPATTN